MDITLRSIKNINQPHSRPHRLATLMLSWGVNIFRISYQIYIDDYGNLTIVDSSIYPETTRLLSKQEKRQILDFINEYLYEEGAKNGKT